MSSPDQITRQAQRNRLWMMAAAVVVVALLSMAAGLYMGRSSDAELEQSHPQAPDEQSLSPQTNPEGEEFTPESGQRLEHNLYEVGFTRTPRGAVSMVLASLAAESTNDLTALTRAHTTYHEGEWDQDKVQGVVLDQRALKISQVVAWDQRELAPDFPGPSSYWFNEPLGVAWQVQDQESIMVMVLVNQEISDGGDFYSKHRYIHARTLQWDEQRRGGDWVITQVNDLHNDPPIAPVEEEHELSHTRWSPLVTSAAGEVRTPAAEPGS